MSVFKTISTKFSEEDLVLVIYACVCVCVCVCVCKCVCLGGLSLSFDQYLRV